MATIHLPYLRWRTRMAPGASEKLAMQSAESPGLRRGLLWDSEIIREGLPMSREPALLTSAGRMPKRSQHRVSEGQDARSERPATGHGQPRTVCITRGGGPARSAEARPCL